MEQGKHSKDWSTEYDGSLVIDGQVVVQPHNFGPDGTSLDEKKANIALAATAPKMADALDKIQKIVKDSNSDIFSLQGTITKIEEIFEGLNA